MLTLGLAGYGGGELARADEVDHCVVVDADSVHRIQETQAALACAVWEQVQERLEREVADAAPTDREAAVLDRIEAFRRRRPTLKDEVITLAHGAGGKASAALVSDVFVDAFDAEPGPLPDAATLALADGVRLAFSTDSFVVKPLRFPGGSIGHLAIHGTVNDLAMQGAVPRWLSAAFVIEEGFPVAELRAIAADMAEAAKSAGVSVVTGDTKVVGRGAADGLFITTAGVGVIRPECELGPERVRPGDAVLVSGTIADHGMAVMLARGDLALEADIRSDTAPLGALVGDLLAAAPGTRWLRDPTRGESARCATSSHATLAMVWRSTRARSRSTLRWSGRATSSVSTRSTSRTRASSSRSSTRMKRLPLSTRCAAIHWEPTLR